MEEILRQMQRMAEPSYLPTMTVNQLYDIGISAQTAG